jgi:transcriptional regulator with PAS, ATPase and Fis domain
MQALYQLIADVASTDVSVLIEGESGTGKELVARAIHQRSARSAQPFVSVNCGALPDTLFESELFGYVRGAFTDARRDKPGLFQQAHQGTLFLDEVGELSPASQVKLLRALQEGEVTPLGATESVAVDVRVLAATNRNLGALIQDGGFRQDLFYRVCVVPIDLPPLRSRREDIVPLVEHLLPLVAAQTGRPQREIAPAALAALYDYDYPGNVRELRNILERALVVCHSERIELDHLPAAVVGRLRSLSEGAASSDAIDARRRLKPSERRLLGPHPAPGVPVPAAEGAQTSLARNTALHKPEVRRVLEALDANHWNRAATALELGISRSTLWRRMKEYGFG